MRKLLWLCAASFILCAGCAVPVELAKDFVTLSAYDDYPDYRAVTGDDARVWLRRFDDHNDGDLAFWAQALAHDFAERGYDVIEQGEVEDAGGEQGHWLRCAANVQGERTGYLVAVWVAPHSWSDGCTVTVFEFAARDDVFAARVDDVKKALATVRR
jgi:hypothetical protein